MTTYIDAITFTSYLKENMPDTATLKTKTEALNKHGATLDSAYTETLKKWEAIDTHVTFPDEGRLVLAFSKNCEGIGAAVVEGLGGIATALDTFATGVEAFVKDSYTPLKTDVEAFNKLHPNEYTQTERDEAIEDGGAALPTATRTAAKRAALVLDLTTARTAYQQLVKTCADAIADAAPTTARPTGLTDISEKIDLLKKSYNLASTWIDRGSNLKSFKGRLGFIWKADAATLSNFVKEGVPGWMKVHDPKSWLGKFLPASFKKKIPDITQMQNWDFFKKWDKKYANFLNGMEGLGRHYWLSFLATLPESWTKNLTGRIGNYVRLNSKIDASGQLSMKWLVNPDSKIDRNTRNVLARFDNAKTWLKNLEQSKVGTVVKVADKLLGPLDAGLNYYDGYTEGYNEALRENPNLTEEEARGEAIATAAFEGTGKTVGSAVGAAVGRVAGAAVGQALIPIPGVGAAVGGFVGGIIGDQVGGFIGEKVGGFFNDVRKDGWGSAMADAGEGIGDGANAAGAVLKEAGSSLLGGAKKLFGWG